MDSTYRIHALWQVILYTIHKPEIPLRPIVLCIGSLTYQLSKYVTSLISLLVGQTHFHAKNSRDFVEMMKDVHIKKDEMLVSFAVTSLFTNVPIDVAHTSHPWEPAGGQDTGE